MSLTLEAGLICFFPLDYLAILSVIKRFWLVSAICCFYGVISNLVSSSSALPSSGLKVDHNFRIQLICAMAMNELKPKNHAKDRNFLYFYLFFYLVFNILTRINAHQLPSLLKRLVVCQVVLRIKAK